MAGLLARALLFLAVASVPALAANYDITWATGEDYSGWATGKSITVGDTISKFSPPCARIHSTARVGVVLNQVAVACS